jgi:hypothetical protein
MQYEKLVEYKQKKGDCLVPFMYKEDTSLSTWVINQRRRVGQMRPERKELLNKLELFWKPNECESVWDMQYKKLVEYKQKKGDCLVPFMYKEDTSLSIWVSHQRRRNGKMRRDRQELLNKLEFVWKTDNLVASSTNDVRGLFILFFYALGRSCFSLSFFSCFSFV